MYIYIYYFPNISYTRFRIQDFLYKRSLRVGRNFSKRPSRLSRYRRFVSSSPRENDEACVRGSTWWNGILTIHLLHLRLAKEQSSSYGRTFVSIPCSPNERNFFKRQGICLSKDSFQTSSLFRTRKRFSLHSPFLSFLSLFASTI